jgi:chromosomal replication initiator protein
MIKEISYWSAPDVLITKKINQNLDTSSLILKVCDYYEITLDQLMSKSRLRKIADARNTLYFILHKCYKLTCTEVGKMFNKNHATILSGSTKIEGFMRFDKVFRIKINQLINIETIKYS